MLTVNGLHINKLPFGELKFLTDILFFEFPSTSVFLNGNSDLVIREWVDCSGDTTIDRYFYYQTNRFFLKEFVNGDLSHLDLILNCVDGVGVVCDLKDGSLINFRYTRPTNLPESYLPAFDTYLEESSFINLDTLNEKVDLTETDIQSINEIYYKDISKKNNAKSFNIHLRNGGGVKHGTIDTDVLGVTALEFDSLYKELAFDINFGNNRGNINTKDKEHQKLLDFAQTQVYANFAASYSIVLRSKYSQNDLFEDSFEESVAARFFKLIDNSLFDSNQLYEFCSDYSIASYLDLLDKIIERDTDIEFAFYEPEKENYIKDDLNLSKAHRAKANIINLERSDLDRFEKEGKFTSLNINSGHFSFDSEGNLYKGYLDDLISESAVKLNFIEEYKVVIERKTIKKPGKKEPTVTDIIISIHGFE